MYNFSLKVPFFFSCGAPSKTPWPDPSRRVSSREADQEGWGRWEGKKEGNKDMQKAVSLGVVLPHLVGRISTSFEPIFVGFCILLVAKYSQISPDFSEH